MLRRLRLLTAGESHGAGLVAVLEGLPAGVVLDPAAVDRELRRRQGGYGRGRRMELEADGVEILGGLKRGRTLGGPLALLVHNRDHRIDRYRRLTRPRPGHADLAGAFKYGTRDCADVMERASARETAARTAAGAVASGVLQVLGVEVLARVVRIGEVALKDGAAGADYRRQRDASPFYSLDPEGDAAARSAVDRAREAGDSLGGAFLVEARGTPPGLGSSAQWDLKLDARLAMALMSVPGIKAVEVGAGTAAAALPGSRFHDAILPGPGGLRRGGNNAGGIEGGISNGQPVVVRVTMKPIPSLRRPLPSVDLETGEAREAVYERSDVCSVPAASVVGEAMAALVLLDALLEKTGGDTLEEVEAALEAHRRRCRGLAGEDQGPAPDPERPEPSR